jgi:sugar (pentulose or hexulose) kinase
VRLLAVLEHNPESTTVTLNRASAEKMLHEIKRLQDGGCARNQGLTQYCAEAAEKDVEIASLKAEVERKDAALNILQAAMTAKKPIPMPFKVAIIEARAALTPAEEKTDD